MDQLDREIAEAFAEVPPPQGPARILMVGGPRRLQSRLKTRLAGRSHELLCANTLAEGQAAVERERFDLLLVVPVLPDGSGLGLASNVRSSSPATRTIVLSGQPSFEHAVEAIRIGAVDFIDPGLPLPELAGRIDAALTASRADVHRDRRLDQLRDVCRKLVEARREASEHLDRLCQDLVAAYQDASEQMTEVAMASEFRTLVSQELDVEDLLRTALEYLLSKTGPTNAAVFLPDSDGAFELGAYVNYDCPRETITVLLNHLCRSVCPQMTDEPEIVSFQDADEFAAWIGAEAGFLAGCEVVAFSCHDEGRCMAVMVLFRSRREPFQERLASTIDILRPIFAEQVANVIRVHHRANPSWPKDPLDDEYDASDYDEFGFGGLVA